MFKVFEKRANENSGANIYTPFKSNQIPEN